MACGGAGHHWAPRVDRGSGFLQSPGANLTIWQVMEVLKPESEKALKCVIVHSNWTTLGKSLAFCGDWSLHGIDAGARLEF